MIPPTLIGFLLIVIGNCLRTNQGRQFILPIPKTTHYAKLEIITDKPTEIVVEGQGIYTLLNMTAKSVHTELLNIQNNGYGGSDQMAVEPKAIFVTADENIWLYVLLGYRFSLKDFGGFMAIPVEHLSTDYIVVTYEKMSLARNFVTVAAVEDNTTVAITVKTSPPTICASINASNGDVSVVSLNRGDVIGFVCEDDITGSRITSDKDVAVVSGRWCFLKWESSCNLLIEMMIPVDSFGTEFILAAPEHDGNFIYRIVPSKLPTTVNGNTGTTYNIGNVGYIDITVSSIVIETSNPSTVIVIKARVINKEIVESKESDMSILPSTDGYLNWYITDEAICETAFQNTDVVYVFGKDQNSFCPIIMGQQCGFFQMIIHMDNATEVNSIKNMTSPRGMILFGMGYNGERAFSLGMLFDTDDCESSPCYNNATCEDGSYSFVCNCIPGFNGTLCEFEIDECLSDACQNNATCHNDINRFFCECKPGFTGLLCETGVDECASTPCQNNATCVDDINRFACQCKPGLTGELCDIEIDECLSSPCQNNASCQDKTDRFVCQCKPDFTGTLCETDLDECLSNPCQNAGTCKDTPGGFACHCETGFYGTTCESVGYAYTYTRLISVDKTLMTSTGETVTDVPLETDIRFETSYTTPLVIQNTPGDNGHSEYDCTCTRYGNSSDEEVDQKVLIDKIQDALLLDKNKLLKTITKYKTMEDDRPSARGIGSVGCMIIIVSILLVVVPDILYLLRQLDDKEKKPNRFAMK